MTAFYSSSHTILDATHPSMGICSSAFGYVVPSMPCVRTAHGTRIFLFHTTSTENRFLAVRGRLPATRTSSRVWRAKVQGLDLCSPARSWCWTGQSVLFVFSIRDCCQRVTPKERQFPFVKKKLLVKFKRKSGTRESNCTQWTDHGWWFMVRVLNAVKNTNTHYIGWDCAQVKTQNSEYWSLGESSISVLLYEAISVEIRHKMPWQTENGIRATSGDGVWTQRAHPKIFSIPSKFRVCDHESTCARKRVYWFWCECVWMRIESVDCAISMVIFACWSQI